MSARRRKYAANPDYCPHPADRIVRTIGGGRLCGACNSELATLAVVPPPPPTIGALRRDPTPQERRAAHKVRPGSQHARIVGELADNGPHCAGVIAERIGLSPNQAATRLGELRRRGLVRWRGAVPCTVCHETGETPDGRCGTCRGMGGWGGELEGTPLGGDGAVWELRPSNGGSQ